MMGFAKDFKKARLINQSRIAIRDVDFKVFMAATKITFVIVIKSDFTEFVTKFIVDGMIFLKGDWVFFTNHNRTDRL